MIFNEINEPRRIARMKSVLDQICDRALGPEGLNFDRTACEQALLSGV